MTELLAPCAIMCDAVPDPAVFWAMVEALGTAVTAVVAVVGVYLIYRQLRQIREQSVTNFAETMRWLVDYFKGDDRFKKNREAFMKAAKKKDIDEILNGLRKILGDVELWRVLLKENYISEDMLFTVVGFSLGRITESLAPFLRNPSTRKRVREVISLRPDAYKLMLKMKEMYDIVHEDAEAWMEGQDGDE